MKPTSQTGRHESPQSTRFATIAVVGRPNVGKSTLVNRIVGEKVTIVSEKPQTTRHRILGVHTRPNGQLVFIDTPGIHRPLHRLNRYMMQAAMGALADTELALLIVDASQPTGNGDRYVIDSMKDFNKPLFILLNKMDLIKKSRLLPLMDLYSRSLAAKEIIPVSALRGDNVDVVERSLWEHAPDGEPMFPSEMHTDRSDAFRAAEIVREKILAHVHEELPWTTAVRVDSTEVDGKLWRIYMTILVEKESQRPIVIGRAGQFLKAIGTEAREELEGMFKKKIYLSLQVRHEEKWRESPEHLASLEIYENE
ncbi:MAG: GTPase Era [Acidobacteriota bacterium]